MGCIIPNSTKEQTLIVPDFTNFFKLNKKNPSIHRDSDATTSPIQHQKKLQSFTSYLSSINDRHIKTLILNIFNSNYQYNEEIANEFLDTITITGNTIQSNQGKEIKTDYHYTFGCKRNNNSITSIDYDFIHDRYMSPHQFDIIYLETFNKFYACDSTKEGTGLFMKIDTNYIIETGAIFNYCNSFMKLIVNAEGKHDIVKKDTLIIHFHDGEYKGKAVSFDPERDKIIRLGRGENNEIVSRNNLVSRIQWTILRKEDDWVIQDGGIEENQFKPSTNGLWLMILKRTEIVDGSLWKTGEKYIVAKINN